MGARWARSAGRMRGLVHAMSELLRAGCVRSARDCVWLVAWLAGLAALGVSGLCGPSLAWSSLQSPNFPLFFKKKKI